ncbi:MAG TPA: deiodinase-related protein, partial [Candidatus Binatia bacterium]
RADWTDPPTIEWAVRYIQDSRALRRKGLHMAPFYAEIVGYRWNTPEKVMKGLVRAGPKAVEDYKRAMQRKQKEGPVPGRIEIED